MSVLVKICGLSTPETLDAALGAGADMVGFVFFPASPRHVDFTKARALGALAKGRSIKVALTVDADNADIENIIETLRPDMLQLHGRETIARVREIRQTFGLPVLKALPVATKDDLSSVAGYAAAADRLLFDAKPPRDATRPGGLGQAFDWSLLSAVPGGVAFMLSGGIHAGNLDEALRTTGARGVDVSSGVETAPGVKDAALIEAFVRQARAAAASPGTLSGSSKRP